MRRSILGLTLVALCGLTASVVVARGGTHAMREGLAAFAPTRAPAEAEEGRALDAGVNDAVIAAVAAQFAGRAVAVKLDAVRVEPVSPRDRAVTGQGRLRIGSDATWLPFGFEVLYDTATSAVSAPRLVLGERSGGHEVEVESAIAQALGAQVDAALREEFSQQPVEFVVDRVVTRVAGSRFLQVDAAGTVDFGPEGATATRVNALYDRHDSRWIRVNYELGAAADGHEAPRRPLAARD